MVGVRCRPCGARGLPSQSGDCWPHHGLAGGGAPTEAQRFGRRVLVRSDDEIGQLGRAFNDLSETLEELFDAISDRERKLDAILSA